VNEFRVPSCEITGKFSPSPAVPAVRSGRTHADHENALLVSTSEPSVEPHCDRFRSRSSDTRAGATELSVYRLAGHPGSWNIVSVFRCPDASGITPPACSSSIGHHATGSGPEKTGAAGAGSLPPAPPA
jgi:hypothetical protein